MQMNRLSRLFQPIKKTPKSLSNTSSSTENLSKSQRLMLDYGLIAPAGKGFFYNLPLAERSQQKLINLIDLAMEKLGAQRFQSPLLTATEHWKKTGRLEQELNELFLVNDRQHRKYLLSPTHEESITAMVADMKLSHKALPLLLYQFTSKFRDELRPKFGLMRSREFLMKDLYAFTSSEVDANDVYNLVGKCYDDVFNTLGIKYRKAHTFLLGTKYSEALGAHYTTQDNTRVPLILGSYGIGVSRLLAASLELLSTDHELRWPLAIAPYTVCIIPAKEGSKEAKFTGHLVSKLYSTLSTVNTLYNNVIVDDRTELTIGRRLLEAKLLGYPYIVVIGKAASQTPSLFEVIDLSSDFSQELSLEALYGFLSLRTSAVPVMKNKMSSIQ